MSAMPLVLSSFGLITGVGLNAPSTCAAIRCAIDAFDAVEPLILWARSLGVTTVHTGHGPGAIVSGSTASRSGDSVVRSPNAVTAAATITTTGTLRLGAIAAAFMRQARWLRAKRQMPRGYAPRIPPRFGSPRGADRACRRAIRGSRGRDAPPSR